MLYSHFTLEWTHCCASIDPKRWKKNSHASGKVYATYTNIRCIKHNAIANSVSNGKRPDHKVRTKNRFDGTVFFFRINAFFCNVTMFFTFFCYPGMDEDAALVTLHLILARMNLNFLIKHVHFLIKVFQDPIQSYVEWDSLGQLEIHSFSAWNFHLNEIGKYFSLFLLTFWNNS